MTRERNHIHSTKIQASLNKFVETIPEDSARNAFDFCFSCFLDKKHQDDLRLTLARNLCIPLINKMSVIDQIQIYSSHISGIMEIIEMKLPKTDDDALEKKTCLMEKSCAFNFLESLYNFLPSNTIKERINPHFCRTADPKGNEVNAENHYLSFTAHDRCHACRLQCQIFTS